MSAVFAVLVLLRQPNGLSVLTRIRTRIRGGSSTMGAGLNITSECPYSYVALHG